jgi:hypothetical protein
MVCHTSTALQCQLQYYFNNYFNATSIQLQRQQSDWWKPFLHSKNTSIGFGMFDDEDD